MNEALTFRLAGPEDDDQIRSLLRRSSMPGVLSMSFTYEPSFFQAIEVEGHNRHVIVAEKGNRILGLGVVSKRNVYMNGVPVEIGYLSRLRLDPSIQNSMALARGYQFLKNLHETSIGVPFYFSSIMEQNESARLLLTSGRGSLPQYKELAKFRTNIIPISSKRRSAVQTKLEVVKGSVVGVEKIVESINEYGRHKNYFPIYSVKDFSDSSGSLKGLSLDDFLVAKNAEGIQGILALWNQSSFRQIVVNQYSGWLKYFGKCGGGLFNLFGWPRLPEIGKPVNIMSAACIAIKNNNPEIFRLLLMEAIGQLKNGKVDYFIVGLTETDPLNRIAASFSYRSLSSRIYRVSWDMSGDSNVNIVDGINYFEVGSL